MQQTTITLYSINIYFKRLQSINFDLSNYIGERGIRIQVTSSMADTGQNSLTPERDDINANDMLMRAMTALIG